MLEKIDVRCTCTMQKTSNKHWVKPSDGYLVPDPECSKCNGKGSIAYPDEDKVEAMYVGICPICGSENGVYFVYPGYGPPREPTFPACMNDKCENEFCQWIDSEYLGD